MGLYYVLDSKISKDHYGTKGKLQDIFIHKYRCKNPIQNISIEKSLSVIHFIKKLKRN